MPASHEALDSATVVSPPSWPNLMKWSQNAPSSLDIESKISGNAIR